MEDKFPAAWHDPQFHCICPIFFIPNFTLTYVIYILRPFSRFSPMLTFSEEIAIPVDFWSLLSNWLYWESNKYNTFPIFQQHPLSFSLNFQVLFIMPSHLWTFVLFAEIQSSVLKRKVKNNCSRDFLHLFISSQVFERNWNWNWRHWQNNLICCKRN